MSAIPFSARPCGSARLSCLVVPTCLKNFERRTKRLRKSGLAILTLTPESRDFVGLTWSAVCLVMPGYLCEQMAGSAAHCWC